MDSVPIGIFRQPLEQVERLPIMVDCFGPGIEGARAIRRFERVMERLIPILGADPMMREQRRVFPVGGQCGLLLEKRGDARRAIPGADRATACRMPRPARRHA